MNLTQPMLAASLLKPTDKHDDETILAAMSKLKKWPVMATVKMDGIRALVTEKGGLVSRTLKFIPNESIYERARSLPVGYDMELWNSSLDYNTIQSIVMSQEHERSGEIQFCVLDDFMIEAPYKSRVFSRNQWVGEAWHSSPIWCNNAEQLFTFFEEAEEQHGEGICFRTPDSPYKQGRSTLREQYLVKLSRFVSTEVTVIGFQEQMENTNSDKYNAIGKMKRQTLQSGMVAKGVLGAFVVKDNHGNEFTVGSGVGMTFGFRMSVWQNQDSWLGKKIVIKSKAHGKLIKPRHPIYWGERKKGY